MRQEATAYRYLDSPLIVIFSIEGERDEGLLEPTVPAFSTEFKLS